jgi:hypothetical protein
LAGEVLVRGVVFDIEGVAGTLSVHGGPARRDRLPPLVTHAVEPAAGLVSDGAPEGTRVGRLRLDGPGQTLHAARTGQPD